MQQAILSLLTSMGGPLVLAKKTSGGDYTPEDGLPAATSKNYACTGKLIEFKDTMRESSLVKVGDRKGLISGKGLSVTPVIGDTITDSDDTIYNIMDVKTVKKQDTVVAYICHLRK